LMVMVAMHPHSSIVGWPLIKQLVSWRLPRALVHRCRLLREDWPGGARRPAGARHQSVSCVPCSGAQAAEDLLARCVLAHTPRAAVVVQSCFVGLHVHAGTLLVITGCLALIACNHWCRARRQPRRVVAGRLPVPGVPLRLQPAAECVGWPCAGRGVPRSRR